MDYEGLLNEQPVKLNIRRQPAQRPSHTQPQPQQHSDVASLISSVTHAQPAPVPAYAPQLMPQQQHQYQPQQHPYRPVSSYHSDLAEPSMPWARMPAPQPLPLSMPQASAAAYQPPPPPQPVTSARPHSSAAYAAVPFSHPARPAYHAPAPAVPAASSPSSHPAHQYDLLSPNTRHIAAAWSLAPSAHPSRSRNRSPIPAAPVVPANPPAPSFDDLSDEDDFDLSSVSDASSSTDAAPQRRAQRHQQQRPLTTQRRTEPTAAAAAVSTDRAPPPRRSPAAAARSRSRSRRDSSLPPPPPQRPAPSSSHAQRATAASPSPSRTPTRSRRTRSPPRYLRPEDDPDESVQVSSSSDEEGEGTKQQQRGVIPSHSSLLLSSSRPSLEGQPQPQRQSRRSPSRSSSRSPSHRHAPRDPPTTTSPTLSEPEDTTAARMSTLSRVYELLDQSRNFYSSAASSTRTHTTTTNATEGVDSSTYTRHSGTNTSQQTHEHPVASVPVGVPREVAHVAPVDESSVHVHVHVHPHSPAPSPLVRTASAGSVATGTSSFDGGASSAHNVSGAADATMMSQPGAAAGKQATASLDVPQQQQQQQQHAGGMSLDDLGDSVHVKPHSSLRDGASPTGLEHDRPAPSSSSLMMPPTSMMRITRAAIPPSAATTATAAAAAAVAKSRRSKPLSPFEPSASSVRRPGPGGAAGAAPSMMSLSMSARSRSASTERGSSSNVAARAAPQSSDVGIFMPSSSSRSSTHSSASTSHNKLAANSARHAQEKKLLTGHHPAVLARLNSVARPPPKPSQCAVSLLGADAASQLASLQQQHREALHLLGRARSPSPPTHPARTTPLKMRAASCSPPKGSPKTKPRDRQATEAAQTHTQQQQQATDTMADSNQQQHQQQHQQLQPSSHPQHVRRASSSSQPHDPSTQPHSQLSLHPDPSISALLRHVPSSSSSLIAGSAGSVASSAASSVAPTPRGLPSSSSSSSHWVTTMEDEEAEAEAEEEHAGRDQLDVFLEPRMKDASTTLSPAINGRGLLTSTGGWGGRDSGRRGLHERAASTHSNFTMEDEVAAEPSSPPRARPSRPTHARSISLPPSPPSHTAGPSSRYASLRLAAPISSASSAHASGRSSPRGSGGSGSVMSPVAEVAEVDATATASSSGHNTREGSRATSRGGSRAPSRARSPTHSSISLGGGGGASRRSSSASRSPTHSSSGRGPSVSIRPAINATHSRSSSWLPSASNGSSVSGASPASTSPRSHARKTNQVLRSSEAPSAATTARSNATTATVAAMGTRLVSARSSNDGEASHEQQHDDDAHVVSTMPSLQNSARSSAGRMDLSVASSAAPSQSVTPRDTHTHTNTSTHTNSNPTHHSADVLSQVSQTLMQSLCAMGLQQDPRARELAQGLLATVATAASQPASARSYSSSVAPPSSHPFIPPLQLPLQLDPPHGDAVQGGRGAGGAPPPHHRRSTSVTFATENTAPQQPAGGEVAGEATSSTSTSSSHSSSRGQHPPAPHPLNPSYSLDRAASRPITSSSFPSSVAQPTTSTLMRERSLAEAQRLITSRPSVSKYAAAAPVQLRRRRIAEMNESSDSSTTLHASKRASSSAAAAASSRSSSPGSSPPLPRMRVVALRSLREDLRSLDASHRARVSKMQGQLRDLQEEQGQLARELEEETLYKLYVQARKEKQEEREYDGAIAADDTAAPDDDTEDDESSHAALLARVASMPLDRAALESHPSMQGVLDQIDRLRVRIVLAAWGHGVARRRLIEQEVGDISSQLAQARASAAFREWRGVSRRVVGTGARGPGGRPMPSHAAAREHMDLFLLSRALATLRTRSSKSAEFTRKLGDLIAHRSLRWVGVLYSSWRARILDLYASRTQELLASNFTRVMTRARQFRAWRLRASRDRFIAWRMERDWEEEQLRLEQEREQAQQQQQQQQQHHSTVPLLLPPAAAAATAQPSKPLPAVAAASSSKLKSLPLSKRDTASSLARQRHIAQVLKSKQQVKESKTAPQVVKRKAAVVVDKPAAVAASTATATSSTAPTASTTPSPSLPSPLSELDELEAQAPALCKYFLREVRREIIDTMKAAAAAAAVASSSATTTTTTTTSATSLTTASALLAAALAPHTLSVSTASSGVSWVPSLTHVFRSQLHPHQLAQLRLIRQELTWRTTEERAVGWVVCKFNEQVARREEEQRVALVRRRGESDRVKAIRSVMHSDTAATTLATQLARMPYVVPVAAPPPPAAVVAAPAAPAVAEALPSPEVLSAPIAIAPVAVAPSASRSASASASTSISSFTAPHFDIEVEVQLPSRAAQRQRPPQQLPHHPPAAPVESEPDEEVVAADTAIDHERERAVRERSALENAWIEAQLHRAAHAAATDAPSVAHSLSDSQLINSSFAAPHLLLSRISEQSRGSSNVSSASVGTSLDQSSQHAIQSQSQNQSLSQNHSQSIADWLREYDLPDPDEEERRMQLAREQQAKAKQMDEDESERRAVAKEEQHDDTADSQDREEVSFQSASQSAPSASASSFDSSAARSAHVSHAAAHLSEEHHLHVHHFPSGMDSMGAWGWGGSASGATAPLSAPAPVPAPTASTRPTSNPPSSTHPLAAADALLLDQLRSMHHSIADIQSKLDDATARAQRQEEAQQQQMSERHSFHHAHDADVLPSRDERTQVSSLKPSTQHTTGTSKAASVRWAHPVAVQPPLSPDPPSREDTADGDSSTAPAHAIELAPYNAADDSDPPFLRRQANLFWARATHGKVFRAWLTRVLLQHLERKAKRQAAAALDTSLHSADYASAIADPELSAALDESYDGVDASFASASSSSHPPPAAPSSFHASTLSGRAIAMNPQQLRPMYPELLRGHQVKTQLEESILEAERVQVEARERDIIEAVETQQQQQHPHPSRPMRSQPHEQSVPSRHVAPATAHLAPSSPAPESDSSPQPSLDELMFERFKRSTDRKAQLQLERMLLKPTSSGSNQSHTVHTTTALSAKPSVPAVHPTERVASSIPAFASPLLDPSDLHDLLAASSSFSSIQQEQDDERRYARVTSASQAKSLGEADGTVSSAISSSSSSAPPSAASTLSLTEVTDVSESHERALEAGRPFSAAASASFDTSVSTVQADRSGDSSIMGSRGVSQLQYGSRSNAARAAYDADSTSDFSSFHPPAPARPLPRLAFQFPSIPKGRVHVQPIHTRAA